jgi:hypothetical protein
MADRRPVLNQQRRKHRATLQRRAAYLAQAIKEPNSDNSRAHDEAEKAALEFALRTIANHFQDPDRGTQ